MPKTKVTLKAKYPDQTQKFIKDICNALEEFKENVHLPDKEIREDAYRVLVKAYQTALTPIWSSAQFVDTEIILETITDKLMTELTIMSKKLAPPPNVSHVSKETRKVPELETLTEALKDPLGTLPSLDICAKITEVFSNLAAAHRTYADVADGLAELSTVLNPSQYTVVLRAAVMPTIQILVPGNLVSPVSAPPPPLTAASTVLGKSEIIKYVKQKVLPDPNSPKLMPADENSTTRVLVAAIYLKVEDLFFDEKSSRMDIAKAFKCKLSQLTKAVTGVNYRGGPHHYKPKPKTTTKRARDSTNPDPDSKKKPKTKQEQASTSAKKNPSPVVTEKEDTLESDSSSDLPPGL